MTYHKHIKMFIKSVCGVRHCRVCGGRENVWERRRSDNVRSVSAACALCVISVDSPALERIDGIFNKSTLVKSVGVDSRLNVIHIRNSKCMVDNVRS